LEIKRDEKRWWGKRFSVAWSVSIIREKFPGRTRNSGKHGRGGLGESVKRKKAETAGTKECGSHEAPMVIRVLLELSLLEDGRRKKIAANGSCFYGGMLVE
jgi:hypothetical protein